MKKPIKILSAVTALTMLCTATAPVFTTAADPAPTTAVVDEDTSLCGYVVLSSLSLEKVQEIVGDTGTVYARDTWSAWYPTITVDLYPGEDIHVLTVNQTDDDISFSLGDPLEPEECDDTSFFVVPKQLDEESVVLTCRRSCARLALEGAPTGTLLMAYPMYQDAEQSGAYATSAFLKAGQVYNAGGQTGLASVNPDDASTILKKYADSLIRPDYVSPDLQVDSINISPMRADVNGDGAIDQADCMLILKMYVDQLMMGGLTAFEANCYKSYFLENFF